ncbi:SulP family inorganic anion transporter [Anaerotignum lactatifermentans]
MSARNLTNKKELPYIPLGPFQWRIPGIHYRIEKVEFFQGIILGATALSSIPYMTDCLGLPYELAWSCVIIEVFLYMLHGWLGDPVVPGWITPTLPFTLVFLEGFEQGSERIQALIAVQLLVAFLFIFMGITKLADRFVRLVPASVKGGILLAAPITVIQGQLAEDSQLMIAPVATLVGTFLLAFLSFSPFCEKKRKTIKILDVMAKYGNLFPYLLAMLIGILLKELSYPELELGTIIRIPDFGEIYNTVSIFAVGVPSLSVFLKAIPLALICYVLAFGDFVTSETLVKEAQESRDDEYIDFNSSRSNLISGLRNLILGIFAPFPPLSGPLWVGMTVSVAMRYREGEKAMKSLIGGMSSFRMATFLSVILIPIVSFMKPIMGVGSAITLLFQAYVCARIGMEYCKSNTDKSIAGVMAAVLAFKGSGWALLVGILMNLTLSNMDFQKKKLGVPTTEELEAIDQERDEKIKELTCQKTLDV